MELGHLQQRTQLATGLLLVKVHLQRRAGGLGERATKAPRNHSALAASQVLQLIGYRQMLQLFY